MNKAIKKRYSKETDSTGLGCANLASFWQIRPGDHVLDLGCGRGTTVFNVARLVGKEGKVSGLDLTPEMINAARTANNLTNVEFIVGDIHNLPYAKEQFDVVLSNCVINHAKDKKQVYNEIYRVLRSGGYFLIGDVTAVEKLPEEVANDPNSVAECWGGAIPKQQYFEFVKAAGFKALEQLSSRTYPKKGYMMESIILKGVKR